MSNLKASCLRLIRNKWFCLFWLLFGLAYVTVYGMLYVEDPFTAGVEPVKILGILIDPAMRATASIIGKTYFWGFKGWGLFQWISLALNILYAYRRYGFTGKPARAGRVCLLLAACCITVCVMIRSKEGFGLQQFFHWSGALLFAFFDALALGLLLVHAAKQSGRAKATLAVFIAMLAAMLGLLVLVGKSGAIESIPMWGAYLILFLLGYTSLYRKCLPASPAPERETAAATI